MKDRGCNNLEERRLKLMILRLPEILKMGGNGRREAVQVTAEAQMEAVQAIVETQAEAVQAIVEAQAKRFRR